jgi:NTE family protein
MSKSSPRIGLALGGGGARGLAHTLVLEAFDELGVKPHILSGTSIGALIGAAYASGLSAKDIHAYCKGLLARRSTLLRHVYSRWNGRLFDYWTPRAPAALRAERIIELIMPEDLPKTFEALQIPLKTVAADLNTFEPFISTSGPLLAALAASAALPALLTPVEIGEHVLIDGGFVNPLPFDLLVAEADFIVAVDVSGGPGDERSRSPGLIETIVNAQQIALRQIINEKLKTARPNLLLKPQVGQFKVLDFLRKEEILSAASPIKEEVKRELEAHLG